MAKGFGHGLGKDARPTLLPGRRRAFAPPPPSAYD